MKNKVPTIAIVGRANVGKSTLFNRLIERRKALVSPIPGTTRDRQEHDAIWRGHIVRFIDTGGTDIKHPDDIEKEIVRQAEIAAKEADLVLFIVDAAVGITTFDKQMAIKMLKWKKPIIVTANKSDTKAAARRANDPWKWALKDPFPISALRGTGSGDLLDIIYEELEKIGRPPAEIIDIEPTHVTVIGKPNVGKSSLLNRLVGDERFITSPVAHTTREPNDVMVTHDGRDYLFVDTAGIRKKSKVRKGDALERESVTRSQAMLRRAHVTLFIVEPNMRIEAQERILAGAIADSKSGAVIVVNKWDTVKDKKTNTIKEFEAFIRDGLPSLKYAPIVFVSALKGQRVDNLFKLIDEVQRQRFREFDHDELVAFLKKAMSRHKPVRGMGTAPPKILGLKQLRVAPPTFELAIKSRRKKKLHPSYVKYLENRMREEFKITGTPIRISIRATQS